MNVADKALHDLISAFFTRFFHSHLLSTQPTHILCPRNAKFTVSSPYPAITFPYVFAHAVSSAQNILFLYYLWSINLLGSSFEFYPTSVQWLPKVKWKDSEDSVYTIMIKSNTVPYPLCLIPWILWGQVLFLVHFHMLSDKTGIQNIFFIIQLLS